MLKKNFQKRIPIKLELMIIQTAKLKFTFASSMKNRFAKWISSVNKLATQLFNLLKKTNCFQAL